MTSAALAPEAHAMTTRRAVTPEAYAAVAISIAVIAIMAAPIVLSALASIKTPADASAIPPSYLPRALSFENYAKVFQFGAGLATYVANSALVAAMTIVACLALAAPAGYGLARFAMRGKEIAFLLLLAPIMIPYQAILTPALSGLRQGWSGQHPHWPRNRPYDLAAAVLDLPDARQL
jgi:multiple sugar transport system permease protein